MPGVVRLSIDSDLNQVEFIARAVRSLCDNLLGREDAEAVELAVVEAMNNIIKHGYRGRRGEAVDVNVTLTRSEVEVEVVDHATPIPERIVKGGEPLAFDFDATDVAGLPEGGMGLTLIRMSMDEVDYVSRPGENRLRMVKRIAAS
ncbi:ATP-binding protein [Methylopila turkensis]|uniref:Histidine kinase/HSP90-like ATPase domain-containing protein n=1 Tax=Methylopila turkensis TaxID=1437816 RepID=A0A9W6JNS8_9HYPH|nr:ATP-binding protein [Methylopila turkensis]GLK79114.1 hypothetical protein GCM10008174_08550 [Methylopila turkensis]